MADPLLQALTDKSILIVSTSEASRQELASGLQSLGMKALMVATEEAAINSLQEVPPIEIVLFEVESPISSAFGFLRRVRALASAGLAPAVILLADRIGPRFEEAYYEGAEAIFVRPIAIDELAKGIAFTFDSELVQAKRQHRRKRLQRARVAYSHSEGLSISAYGTNISVGGMFIASMDDLPVSGQEIGFRLQFEALKEEIQGNATVRWVRTKIDSGRPRGFGIEFKGLEAASLEKIRTILESDKS